MSMREGTVVRWLKAEGDHVTKGDPLLEVETDKVTAEIEATVTGTLVRIAAQLGDVVEVQGLLGEIETDADGS
jgi:pyruvate/2-oxoglutarate dehydrogenase complex dihydrolipoamide acyltransferase (E2) component